MMKPGNNKRYRKWIIALFVLIFTGASVVWYVFTEKFADTDSLKADHIVNAVDLISAFQLDMTGANKKYSEKILVVNGIVSAIETADTTANIKMMDTVSGAYIIFAFQQQHLEEARRLQAGDRVSIKGSCSNGAYSNILETEYITFKRCAINK